MRSYLTHRNRKREIWTMSIAEAQNRFAASFWRIRRQLAEWKRVARTRRALSRLDSHLLRDIGVTAMEQEEESRRPFWR